MQNSRFKFGPTAVITNSIDGGGGVNTFDYTGFTTQVTLNLAASAISRITNPFANIQNIIAGSSATNLIQGYAAGAIYHITAANSGNVNGISFSHFAKIAGGAGDDTFVLSDGAGLTGSVDGGGGTNWLDYTAYTKGISVNLGNGSATANIRNVKGGSGNDALYGNSLGNILMGGPGNDTLIGGSGRSILIGGTGSDVITGGSNDDIVIGGTTTYDSNFAAIDTILAEWQSTADSYATRISRIKNGGGLNGVNTLVWGTSVLDDSAADILKGNAGNDWFFEGIGDTDDHVAGEQIN